MSESAIRMAFASDPFGLLRQKWVQVPAGQHRFDTRDLLDMPPAELVDFWRQRRNEATTGDAYSVRGWYHDLYSDVFRGQSVLDLGSGLGLDGITFALAGANLVFADIVGENLEILRRLCREVGIVGARFVELETLQSLAGLPGPFDAIYAQGSLINAPAEIIREEIRMVLEHLPIGGRWIELAYPRERWLDEGELPFDEWGLKTDGAGTPWVEWYDLAKRLETMAPARFDPLLAFNFHDNDFNWFDLIRRT